MEKLNIKIFQVNRLAFTAAKKEYIICILLYLLMSGNVFLNLYYSEYNMNLAYDLLNRKITFANSAIGIAGFTIGMICFSILNTIKKYIENKLILKFSYNIEYNLDEQLSKISWEYFETHDINLKIHETRTKGLDSMKSILRNSLYYISIIPLIFIYLYYLFRIYWIFVLVYFILFFLFNKKAQSLYKILGELWENTKEKSQKQEYLFKLTGDMTEHQEYKFYRMYHYISNKWDQEFENEYKITSGIYRKTEILNKLASVLYNIPRILILLVTMYEVAVGKHDVGIIIAINSVLTSITNMIMQIQENIQDDIVNSYFVRIYNEILGFITSEDRIKVENTDIVFRNITYSYPQSNVFALKNINLTIKKGEKIFIVGTNGSGKTTFTNLILSLIQNYEGILMTPSLKKISVITQEFLEYQGTVRDNILLNNKNISDPEIWEILKKVGLYDYIYGLPDKLNTFLGHLENGIQLSKGQWQKIAMARLLAKKDASIWILDEPTAHLDPLSEIEVYNLVKNLAGDRTVIFISHRLGFSKDADRVIVFDKGRIVEEGTHDALIQNTTSYYSKLYLGQLEWYI
ncbi:MAG: ABC transporter ATP-binding protein [Lachnospiraceae bacterium]|nr:ABC transporter ATP-binding protein [Lachnospiraceae bacterium]